MDWRLAFPKASIYHLGAIKSDHSPLLLDSNPPEVYTPRPFRFEVAWACDPKCKDIIDGAWKRVFVGCPESIL